MAAQFGGLNIPPLLNNDRIEDWEKLFRAAVASPLTQEGGQRLAISMLPAYVCRRVAEREIVREVVSETGDLDQAFKTLRDNLDTPVDVTKSMQSIREQDWQPGTLIDDYFYELKVATLGAKAPLRVACVVLITQLPHSLQSSINDWLMEKEDVSPAIAREFILKVRRALVEKNIPLDKGYREFAKVLDIRSEDQSISEGKIAPEQIPLSPDHANETINVVQRWDRGVRPGGRSRGNKWGWGSRNRSSRMNCYVCGSSEHLQRNCPSQYCQSCGKKGHDRRDCFSKKQVFSVDHRFVSNSSQNVPLDLGVMVSLRLNGRESIVMLNSGAQPSVIDTMSLEELRVPFQVCPSQVHGVGDTAVPTRGFVDLRVDCGNGIALDHKFVVLDSVEHTIILGRDFLKRFRSTEFDWDNRRVRLGPHWLQTEACLWGGHVLSRAGAVWNVLQEGGVENGREGALTDEWNVNPSLDRHQRAAMTKLLEEYWEVFARNPKKPKQTFLMEHVINTGNALPVKSGYVINPLISRGSIT